MEIAQPPVKNKEMACRVDSKIVDTHYDRASVGLQVNISYQRRCENRQVAWSILL